MSKTPRVTKIEMFLKALIDAETVGVKPVELAQRLNTTCITKYAYELSLKGVYITKGYHYRLSNKAVATDALHLLNKYRVKRGCNPLPSAILLSWS